MENTLSNLIAQPPQTAPTDALTISSLIFNPQAFQALENMAEMLCKNSGMVPEHLRNKKGDMMAIIMQSARWNLDVLMVAQSTFCVNGIIGYEAKLIQAIVKSNGNICFTGEYYGDWGKIVGNTKTQSTTKKGKYGDYSSDIEVPNWTQKDELSVGYRIIGRFPDGTSEELDVPLVTCKPRHSTNWTLNPKQQIHYTGVKRWVRQFAPHLAAGVKDYDDVVATTEKEINPKPKDKTMAPVPVKMTKSEPKPLCISKAEEIENIIKCTSSINDTTEVYEFIAEAYKKKQITQDEAKNLSGLLKAKYEEILPADAPPTKK